MGSNQAKPIDDSESTEDSTNIQPPILPLIDEIDMICGFHPFSLRSHEKDFHEFLKSKFSKDLDSLLQQAISKDDQESFLSLLKKSSLITQKDWWSRPTNQKLKLGYAEVCMKNIFSYICKNKAYNCATVLLERGLGVNVNIQIPCETMPLKWAAADLNSEFTTLFQSHGGQADETELQIAIDGLSNKLKWKRGEPVAKLLHELRYLHEKDDLDTIKWLTNDKKVVERTFEAFLRDLSVDRVAILLMVAEKTIRSPKCAQYFEELCRPGKLSDHQSDDLSAMQMLIKSFQGADLADLSHQQWSSKVRVQKKFGEDVRTIHTKPEFRLGTKEANEKAFEKPTIPTSIPQRERISQHTSPSTGKEYRHFSTFIPNSQPICGYYIQKSKFSTLCSGNAEAVLKKSLRTVDRGILTHASLGRRLAFLAMGIKKKSLLI